MRRFVALATFSLVLFLAACGGGGGGNKGGSSTPTPETSLGGKVIAGLTVKGAGYTTILPANDWTTESVTGDLPSGVTSISCGSNSVKLSATTGGPSGTVPSNTVFVHLLTGPDSEFPTEGLSVSSDPLAELADAFFGIGEQQTTNVTPYKSETYSLDGSDAIEDYLVDTVITSSGSSSSSSGSPALETTMTVALFARHGKSFYTAEVTSLPQFSALGDSDFANIVNSWKWS